MGPGPVLVSDVDGVPTLEMGHDPEVAPRSLPLLLAHGITTALDPGGPTELLTEVEAAGNVP